MKAYSGDRSQEELTDADAAEIKLLLELGHQQKRIAALFDVNMGRISEINSGRRFANVKAWRPK